MLSGMESHGLGNPRFSNGSFGAYLPLRETVYNVLPTPLNVRIHVTNQNITKSRPFGQELVICCQAWIRTMIHGFKGRCPTIRRPDNVISLITFSDNYARLDLYTTFPFVLHPVRKSLPRNVSTSMERSALYKYFFRNYVLSSFAQYHWLGRHMSY